MSLREVHLSVGGLRLEHEEMAMAFQLHDLCNCKLMRGMRQNFTC